MSDAAPPPYRRAVFYMAGFDNIGARFYYALFARGMARASSRDGRRYTLSKLAPGEGASTWRIETSDGGRPVEVDYFFLTPQTVVRSNHSDNPLWIIAGWALASYAFLRYGVLYRAFRRYWPGALVLAYALICAPLYFIVGAALTGLVAHYAAGAPWYATLAAALAGGVIGLRLGLRFDRSTYANYLLSATRMAAVHGLRRDTALDDMADQWAALIAARQAERRWDDVLLVGHSSGATSAIDVAARLLAMPAEARPRPLSLLTLGSTDGIVACFPAAVAHRQALAEVATRREITWIEYYSYYDFISMGPIDPIDGAQADLGGKPQLGPIRYEVEYHEILNDASYAGLRFNIFKRHFQYLKAADNGASYCYFRLVSAARPIAETAAAAVPSEAKAA